jgi:hypothetical protein
MFSIAQTGYSSSLPAIRIMSEEEAARNEFHWIQWGAFFAAVSAAVGGPLYLYVQGVEGLKHKKQA